MRYCLDCGFVGYPKRHTPGTFLMELVLWIFFIIPGVIYSIWRLSGRYSGCAKCGSKRIVLVDSPIARAALNNLGLPSSSGPPRFCTGCGKPIAPGADSVKAAEPV
jgi:hypothetical protein